MSSLKNLKAITMASSWLQSMQRNVAKNALKAPIHSKQSKTLEIDSIIKNKENQRLVNNKARFSGINQSRL